VIQRKSVEINVLSITHKKQSSIFLAGMKFLCVTK